jgi:hypothetical protein
VAVAAQIEVAFNIGRAPWSARMCTVSLKIEGHRQRRRQQLRCVELLFAASSRSQHPRRAAPALPVLRSAPRCSSLRAPRDRRCDPRWRLPAARARSIDFASLYMQRAAQVEAEAHGGQASLQTGDA